LGILLKGPIAVAVAAVIVGAFALARSRWCLKEGVRLPPTELGRSLWWGIPVVVVIAAPWFIWANNETNNQVWEVFFYYHNFERGVGGSDSLASHPFWFYGPRMLVDLLPWSLALLPAMWYFARHVSSRTDPLAWFGVLWFLAVFGLLSSMSF